MPPRVIAFVSPDLDLYHASCLFTGFSALARRAAIDLRYQLARGDERWLAADPVVLCFDVEEGRSLLRIAVDLRDGEGVSRPILDRVDRYLKRAFSRRELDTLPAILAGKIQPYGLNFACRSVGSTVALLRMLGGALVRRGRPGLRNLREYLRMPGPSAFEQRPQKPVESTVIFQTRLWTHAEVSPDEVEPLNTERVAIVRALRRGLGDRFVGGLIPTPFALANYPAEVTRHSSNKSDYIALKKRHLIAVYTRGIEHSLAFKLGETLAASQCLVSVPLEYELPEPLVSGRHYLPFETPDQCVDACQRLLDWPAMAVEMRHANHDYYVREVEPAAHVAQVLARINHPSHF